MKPAFWLVLAVQLKIYFFIFYFKKNWQINVLLLFFFFLKKICKPWNLRDQWVAPLGRKLRFSSHCLLIITYTFLPWMVSSHQRQRFSQHFRVTNTLISCFLFLHWFTSCDGWYVIFWRPKKFMYYNEPTYKAWYGSYKHTIFVNIIIVKSIHAKSLNDHLPENEKTTNNQHKKNVTNKYIALVTQSF